MIFPTPRAVIFMALGIFVALICAMIRPELWAAAGAWIALVCALMCVDALLAPRSKAFDIQLKAPAVLYTDDKDQLDITLKLKSKTSARFVDIRPETNTHIKTTPFTQRVEFNSAERAYRSAFNLKPQRRGDGKLQTLWLRWQGPLGLIWKQKQHAMDTDMPVVSNAKYVTQNALKFFSRDAASGQKIELDRGEGSEFDNLRDFVAGMDKRSIDWKHSARHRKLQAKEYRTERNHNIIFAIDSGRLMCEPLHDVPRIDRALNAAMLMAFVSLRIGDKVGIYSFDSKPRLLAKPVSSTQAYASIQKQTALIDYSTEETNFTLGLTQLGRSLNRRSLVIIFTEFVDTVSAELMIENISRLVKKHLVLFVSVKDSALEDYINLKPQSPYDISRAVIASALSQERDVVLAKLKRMGVQIIDTEYDKIGPQLINRVLDLKRREMI